MSSYAQGYGPNPNGVLARMYGGGTPYAGGGMPPSMFGGQSYGGYGSPTGNAADLYRYGSSNLAHQVGTQYPPGYGYAPMPSYGGGYGSSDLAYRPGAYYPPGYGYAPMPNGYGGEYASQQSSFMRYLTGLLGGASSRPSNGQGALGLGALGLARGLPYQMPNPNRNWGVADNVGDNRALAQLTGYGGDFGSGGFNSYMQTASPTAQSRAAQFLRSIGEPERISWY